MRIRRLRLENFRCFEKLELNLEPDYTVLVGINGAGKSTILDGLSIALGGYLTGFDGIKSNYILPEDAHYRTYASGSRIDVQEQYPVGIEADAEIDMGKKSIRWCRSLNGKMRRTTHGQATDVVEYARELQNALREGDKKCVLPLISYYGTGRLWARKRNKKAITSDDRKMNRQMGYIDCLEPASNEKQMMAWFEEMTYIQLQENCPIPELEAVKRALSMCYMSSDPDILDAKFTYDVKSHELEVVLYKTYGRIEKLPVRMLSDGVKGIISLVADIAYRMALLNPNLLDDALMTPGVVLIDEIDMHLHPMWQKKIMSDLTKIFPNVQFVVTTHSPNVLTNIKKEHIRILDHYHLCEPQNATYGRSVEDILLEVMGVDVRPDQVRMILEKFSQAIDNENYQLAQQYLHEMKAILGSNAKEVVESQITLDVEMLGE